MKNDKENACLVGNSFRVLVPSRSFKIKCGWLEKSALSPLPLQACKLLIAIGELSPDSLQLFFGLNQREFDSLAQELLDQNAIRWTVDGNIEPSSTLSGNTLGVEKYEERTETVYFEMLTFSIRGRSRGRQSGPFIMDIPSFERSTLIEKATASYRTNYRAHLDLARTSDDEKTGSVLYRLGACIPDKPDLLAVDVDLRYELDGSGNILRTAVLKDASSKSDMPFSADFETTVLKFLGERCQSEFPDMTRFLRFVQNTSLPEFMNGRDFSAMEMFSAGLADAALNPNEHLIVGPLFQSKQFIKFIQKTIRSYEGVGTDLRALWWGSDSMGWAAHSENVQSFCDLIDSVVRRESRRKSSMVSFFNADERGNPWHVKQMWSDCIPNAIYARDGNFLFDEIEFFAIPGVVASVSVYGPLDDRNRAPVPVGIVSAAPEFIAAIETELKRRFCCSSATDIAWKSRLLKHRTMRDLLPINWFPDKQSADSKVHDTKGNIVPFRKK